MQMKTKNGTENLPVTEEMKKLPTLPEAVSTLNLRSPIEDDCDN